MGEADYHGLSRWTPNAVLNVFLYKKETGKFHANARARTHTHRRRWCKDEGGTDSHMLALRLE